MSPAEILNAVRWLAAKGESSTARQLLEVASRDWPDDAPVEFVRLAMDIQAWSVAIRWLEGPAGSSIDAQQMLAFSLQRAGRFADSAAAYDRVIRAEPGLHSAKVDKALCLQAWGAWDQAVKLLNQVADDADAPSRVREMAMYKLGWHRIRMGEFEKGMEWNRKGRRLQHWGAYLDVYQAPMLDDGESVDGKTTLVVGEAGIGDEVLNFRFCRHLVDRGSRVIYRTRRPELAQFFERNAPEGVEIESASDPSLKYDRWVAAQDLPVVLKLRASDLGSAPYLRADESHLQRWKLLLPEGRGLRIGLRWRGDPEVDREQDRSLPERELAALIDKFPNAKFFSFENEAHGVIHPRLENLPVPLQNWETTAAALTRMDVLVSSCTSVVHMAGALGVPTFVLCQTIPYYTWAENRDPSSWYCNVMPILKQKADWSESFREVARRLEEPL